MFWLHTHTQHTQTHTNKQMHHVCAWYHKSAEECIGLQENGVKNDRANHVGTEIKTPSSAKGANAQWAFSPVTTLCFERCFLTGTWVYQRNWAGQQAQGIHLSLFWGARITVLYHCDFLHEIWGSHSGILYYWVLSPAPPLVLFVITTVTISVNDRESSVPNKQSSAMVIVLCSC